MSPNSLPIRFRLLSPAAAATYDTGFTHTFFLSLFGGFKDREKRGGIPSSRLSIKAIWERAEFTFPARLGGGRRNPTFPLAHFTDVPYVSSLLRWARR